MKPVGGARRRWIVVVVAVAGGGSGGSSNVVLRGGLGGHVFGILRGDALCLSIGGCGSDS